MAALQFHIHTDSENVTSTVHKPMPGKTHVTGAKTFQSGVSNSLMTPRRALGAVNQSDRVPGIAPSQTGAKLSIGVTPVSAHKAPTAQFQKPSTTGVQKQKSNLKSSKISNQLFPSSDKENNVDGKNLKQEKSVPTSVPSLQPKPNLNTIDPSLLPEIEYMPPPEPADRDDEGGWLGKDSISSYVSRIRKWRPSCLFGVEAESEDEEEAEIRTMKEIEELANIPLPNLDGVGLHFDRSSGSLEAEDLDSLQLPAIDDDDAFQEVDFRDFNSSTGETSVYSLDDSSISMSKLGTLALKDSLPGSPAC